MHALSSHLVREKRTGDAGNKRLPPRELLTLSKLNITPEPSCACHTIKALLEELGTKGTAGEGLERAGSD